MTATNEIARLSRAIEDLQAAMAIDLRPAAKPAMTMSERRTLRARIEEGIQALDELRAKLSG